MEDVNSLKCKNLLAFIIYEAKYSYFCIQKYKHFLSLKKLKRIFLILAQLLIGMILQGDNFSKCLAMEIYFLPSKQFTKLEIQLENPV